MKNMVIDVSNIDYMHKKQYNKLNTNVGKYNVRWCLK